MRTTRASDWLKRRWDDIVHAAHEEIGGWANEYSNGYIVIDRDDFPKEPPELVPLYDRESSWYEWPSKNMYAEVRTIGDTKFPGLTHEQRRQRFVDIAMGAHVGPIGREYLEFHFGTYAVFRVTDEEYTYMNEGYEDEAGSENERVLEDDGHKIVVYML